MRYKVAIDTRIGGRLGKGEQRVWQCDLDKPGEYVSWFWPLVVTSDWVAIPAEVTGGTVVAYPAHGTVFSIEELIEEPEDE
jgi:hypothetical protein